MDGDLLLIFTFVLVIATIALTMAQVFHRRAVRHEERKLELKARIAEAKSGETEVSSDAHRKLEERVRVLERIVTDGNDDLARQIESLRDLQEIDQLTDKREKAQ
ncbi:MAG TPA: hypothetical protein DCS24_08725 [Erythrobacter sp.]|nr:hypothetical protein [Erythrobacter sp.]